MLLQCSACNQLIADRYFTRLTIEDTVYLFCSSDCYQQWQQKQRKCFVCGTIILSSSYCYQYGDGRVSCKGCFDKSILYDSAFVECRNTVLRFLCANFGYMSPCGVVPQLHDRFVFRTRFNLISHDVWGVYGLREEYNITLCQIGVLRGLPSDMCESTLAHEYAHDMMYHRWGYVENPVLREGFARYVEYQYNVYKNYLYLNKSFLTKPDNDPFYAPYYDGLQLMLSAEKNPGAIADIFEFIDRNKTKYQ